MVVEVRSPSNVGPAWENKLFEYRDTPSIEQIAIIESETRSVRSYVRAVNGFWQEQATIVGDGILSSPTIDVELTLDEIYRKTSLDVMAS